MPEAPSAHAAHPVSNKLGRLVFSYLDKEPAGRPSTRELSEIIAADHLA